MQSHKDHKYSSSKYQIFNMPAIKSNTAQLENIVSSSQKFSSLKPYIHAVLRNNNR